jgi:adenylyltransferase/sulfurtransferase
MLLVGIGGLGCPAAMALARAGVPVLGLCDDDSVERSNLHRQILFRDEDVGKPKVEVAASALRTLAPGIEIEVHDRRLLPDNAAKLVREYDIVLEGTDNFATKFLVADACVLAGVPVVHASAVRWVGTALAVAAGGRPCYRCIFEDIPRDGAPNCAEAGVMGPVLGIIAAAQVDLALTLAEGDLFPGELVTFDGRVDELRRRTLQPRADCSLCGQPARIRRLDPDFYTSPATAG